MQSYIDLTKTYKKYKGKWVVLDKNLDNVIVAASSAKKAYQEAVKKGQLKPTLFKVPPEERSLFWDALIC